MTVLARTQVFLTFFVWCCPLLDMCLVKLILLSVRSGFVMFVLL